MERRLEFVKMQGCGNDYIFIDCLDTPVPDPSYLAIKLSDRHFGIGGDGAVLICPSDKADAKMRMFNRDGSEGLMCGNAVRCVGKYLYDVRGVRRGQITVETLAGVRVLDMIVRGGIATGARVMMGKAEFAPQNIPVLLAGESVIGRKVTVGGAEYTVTCVSVGNPHCVVFCGDPDALDIEAVGPEFENSPLFPERVNTEFVRAEPDGSLYMRVWERGSGETLACGTGACAAAAAAVENGFCLRGEDIPVRLRGGTLTVRYDADGTLFMTGDAVEVFRGSIEADAPRRRA